ncbi:MAG: hypothetical protein COA78_28470 [Blastopirellula sp.]|nr:MAG: hypothetical protein COA78_28470 [Blastopirellula sp.]
MSHKATNPEHNHVSEFTVLPEQYNTDNLEETVTMIQLCEVHDLQIEVDPRELLTNMLENMNVPDGTINSINTHINDSLKLVELAIDVDKLDQI